LSRDQRRSILHGGIDHKSPWGKNVKEFEGVIGNLGRRYKESESAFVKEEIQGRFMRSRLCPDCRGARLKPEALAVTVGGKSIAELVRLSVLDANEFFKDLPLSERSQFVARQVLKEIRSRLSFLVDVGLGLRDPGPGIRHPGGRRSPTDSPGHANRFRLGGRLYVLDEPTIGLHPRDNERLLTTLKRSARFGQHPS
jgi:excinuclease ABC subunit A